MEGRREKNEEEWRGERGRQMRISGVVCVYVCVCVCVCELHSFAFVVGVCVRSCMHVLTQIEARRQH